MSRQSSTQTNGRTRGSPSPLKITPEVGSPLSLALRPREAALALGIGERLLWSLTNRGEIPHLKLGRATLYPVAELQQWLTNEARRGLRQ